MYEFIGDLKNCNISFSFQPVLATCVVPMTTYVTLSPDSVNAMVSALADNVTNVLKESGDSPDVAPVSVMVMRQNVMLSLGCVLTVRTTRPVIIVNCVRLDTLEMLLKVIDCIIINSCFRMTLLLVYFLFFT